MTERKVVLMVLGAFILSAGAALLLALVPAKDQPQQQNVTRTDMLAPENK